MPRHVPDDFSFLPTVDSTDNEIVAKETLWKSKPPPSPPEIHEPEYEPAAEHYPVEEPVYEQPVHEEPAHEEVAAAPPAPAPPVFSQEPQPAKKVRVFEPDAAHSSAEAEQSSPASLKETEAPVQAGKETPPIKIQMPQMAVPPPPPVLPKQEGPASTPAHHTPKEVRLTILPPVVAPPAPAAKRLPTIDDALEEAKKEGAEGKAGDDPKPFTAPKPPAEEPLDPDQLKKLRWKKLAEKIGLRTLGMSVGVHLFLLLVAAFITVTQVMDRQVDFLPGGSSPQSQAAAEALTHKVQNKKNPWLKAKPQQRKITVQSLSADMVLPEMPPMDMMDFSSLNSRMDLSKAPSMGAGQPMGMGGAGGGFGAGIGRGGKFSFVGQTATGRRVVFVVDVSGSMSAIGRGETISRFDLLKKELNKTLSQMPMGTAYQILFFSDFAWPHNEVDSRNGTAMEKYRWEIESKDYKKVKIPTFKYILASPFTVQDSKNIIQNADNPGGTNWGSGLLMALNANPKPDVIFFMTDGNRSDEMGWIDVVTAENKRKLPMTAIYTSAMQQPDAARELDTLAKRNNGRFTVVMGEGKVIKGEDFFNMK
ncbi:hypothetical protein [Prosthecobacter sp.]|uniref:hypothetical protein n=1 Tax=Prosthecobacter sp. TaxID=1965333 RepID=UPI0037847302